uniref:Sugar phosphate transporter domain-containing protein n=1 Tax=Romanomermis culicivorax TaxID=13658 RepID=A0A915LDC5_ROMCU
MLATTQADPESKHAQSLLFLAYAKIIGAVTLYWSCSITMVFLNKHLLSSPDLKLDAPLFITWYQCIVSILICFIMSLLAEKAPNYVSFPKFRIDPKICWQISSLSTMFVAMITFNNLCLKYVGVSFYFIGRSLTTVFNVICVYFILGQRTSLRAILCCLIIIGGFFLGVDQEDLSGTLSKSGVFYGIMASLAVALNAIYTKKALPVVSDNLWLLTLYNNVNAVALFLPLMFIFGEMKVIANFDKLNDLKFWALMSMGGGLGFAMSYVTGLQIQVTSPLTHNISGTAKAAAQTVIAVAWFYEIKTLLWWLSNVVVLLGSAAYTFVKQQEMKKQF